MERKIKLGVDELTLVLSVDKSAINGIEDWQPKAESIITEFAGLAELENIFGMQKELESKCPQGYSVAYQYGDNPFYFAIAYHPSHPMMGIVVKFSAHSWAEYCKNGQTNIKRFLHSVQSDSYNARLSRVDFTADYQNWDISVNRIYQKLKDHHLEIHDYKGRKNHSEINAYESNGIANTFYVGSKRTGTRLFLRAYDKRQEQIKKRGFRFEEAVNTTSWVRFEAVFKEDYAHQLTGIIMENDEENLPNLIADKIAEKYRFYNRECEKYEDFSTALIEESKKQFHRLRLESPRDNDLIRSLLHIIKGSGLFPVLYKCDKIWGDEASTDLLKGLCDIYTDAYQPNDDVLLWLKKHKNAMEKQSLKDMLKILKASRMIETDGEINEELAG